MRGNGNSRYCTSLRKIISSCKGSQDFHSSRMQDAGEFVLFLFNIFQVDVMRIQRTTYLANDLHDIPNDVIKTRSLEESGPPIHSIHVTKLEEVKEFNLQNCINETEDSILDKKNLITYKGVEYRRRIEVKRILSSPYMIFYAQRLDYNENRNKTRVICPDTIKIGDTRLSLYAIVVHKAQHYTCYIKYGEWYYYDDMRNGIEKIGSINQVRNYSLLFKRAC